MGVTKMSSVEKIIDESNLPNTIKSIIKEGIELNADPDIIISTVLKELDKLETKESNNNNPILKPANGYTKLEREIANMLIENSGCSILDSGAVYGRHFEHNRKVEDFRENPKFYAKVYTDGSIDFSIDTFHFLNSHLIIDDLSERLDIELKMYLNNKTNDSYPQIERLSKFADDLIDRGVFYGYYDFNTYNMDSLLTQVLQGLILKRSESDEHGYVILQIHNGCDVRYGYTSPKVFKLKSIMDFWIDQEEYSAYCGCQAMHVNGGEKYSDYGNICGLPKGWKVHKNKDEYFLKCGLCKQKVKFTVGF